MQDLEGTQGKAKIATYAWLAAVTGFFFGSQYGMGEVMYPNELGDYLAGMLTPLALLWLILGYRQQGRELEQTREQIRLQTEELKHSTEELRHSVQAQNRQAESIKENALHASRDVFLQLSELMFEELANCAAQIARIRHDALATGYKKGTYSRITLFSALITHLTSGFSEYIKVMEGRSPDYIQCFKDYCRVFDDIIREANISDPQGKLEQFFQNSTAGQLYILIKTKYTDFLA